MYVCKHRLKYLNGNMGTVFSYTYLINIADIVVVNDEEIAKKNNTNLDIREYRASTNWDVVSLPNSPTCT